MAVKRAILLAAGLGTRLKPLTNSIPKCLVPINGKPLLHIWLEQLDKAGIEHFYINTHYFVEQVEKSLEQHPLRSKITLVYEPELLGTAGTVKNIITKYELSTETLLIAHADNLCFCSWPLFIEAHLDEQPLLSMMAFETDKPQSCGILELDEQNKLLAFHEKVKQPPGNLANAAVYVFSMSALEYLKKISLPFPDISLDLIPLLMSDIRVWKTDGYLRDIGSPESYEQALKDAIVLNQKYAFS